MSNKPTRRIFRFLPPAIPQNSEKIQVEQPALPIPQPASAWLDDQYGYIGGRHGGNVVECLSAGNKELAQTTKRQHDLNRALVAICWHLAKKVVDDDLEYTVIMDLPRWKDRHIRPKLDDDISARCRFMAFLMFSDLTGQNDNGAAKKGRIVAHLIESGVGEDIIMEHLSRTGGVGRVYEEALAKVSLTADKGVSAETSLNEKRTPASRKSSSSGARAELVNNDPVQTLKRLVAHLADHVDLEPSVILADVNVRAIFAEANPNDVLQLTAKRVDRGGDCVVFHVSAARPVD